MNDKQSLSIILPVYNEEEIITTVVEKIVLYINNLAIETEIILVNDGSTDKTSGILLRLSRKHPCLRIINTAFNQGYGTAIRSGILAAEKEWLLIMDADGQFRIRDLSRLWENKARYDFLVGYRKQRRDALHRILLGKLGNILANLFFKTDIFIKDINCGFKLFRTEQLKILTLSSIGGFISFEILYKLLRNRYTFTQLPVTHYQRTTGKATGGNIKIIAGIAFESLKALLQRQLFHSPPKNEINAYLELDNVYAND